MMRARFRSAIVLFLAAASLIGIGQIRGVSLAGAHPQQVVAPQHTGRLVYRGTVNLRAAAGPSNRAAPIGGRYPARRADLERRSSAVTATGAAPNPPLSPIFSGTGGAQGFVGLTAATSGSVNGVDVEPPDQGLCAHRGVALETVNLAVRAYSESGAPLTRAVSLNAFFGLSPAQTSHNPPTYGPFVSDPRCYYDAQTGRWFMTALEIDVNPYTGALGYRSSQLIAVSQTADPTGNYGLFSFDTTNDGVDGTSKEPNCPCFGDQPRTGADAYGFYVSTESFPIHGFGDSNGGELYAISKQGLAAAADGSAPAPAEVAIHAGAVRIGGFPANALQPAQTPEGGSYAANREFFLNTPDFNGDGATGVVLWTLLRTSTLASSSPSVALSHAIVPSERYTPPVSAEQKPGPRPLGQSLNAPLPPLDVGDDRMQQVEYVGGQLFSSLSTGVASSGRGPADRAGVAWFVLTPNGTSGVVSHQGYLAAGDRASLMYPALALNPDGQGAMTFSVSGPTHYPSAAYVSFSRTGAAGPIYLNGPGSRPEDGFSCYGAEGGGPSCRWGDYSAASADGTGHIVMADEMIPNAPRDQLANWGTFLSTLKR